MHRNSELLMKYTTLLLGLAILMASVVAAATEPYSCYNGTFVDLDIEAGKVRGYTIRTNDLRRQADDRVCISRDRYGAPIVMVNGKRCEILE